MVGMDTQERNLFLHHSAYKKLKLIENKHKQPDPAELMDVMDNPSEILEYEARKLELDYDDMLQSFIDNKQEKYLEFISDHKKLVDQIKENQCKNLHLLRRKSMTQNQRNIYDEIES